MEQRINNLLNSIHFEAMQEYANLKIFPFIYRNGNKLLYTNTDEAIDRGLISITETSDSGSVPEILIVNDSDERVLLLDGEELVGSKQNRILNTSIMVETKSKTMIPVSCVESGRWSYSSRSFSSSGRVSPSSLKMSKMSSVSQSLASSQGLSFKSDQRKVWDEVDRISVSARVQSPSRAMSDIFDNRNSDIESYLKSFKILDDQNGFVVSLGGQIVGLEYISNRDVFKKLFPKLIKGYSMDAIINSNQEKASVSEIAAQEFIALVGLGIEEPYKSIGLGYDHRINSEDIVGSALIVEDEIVHLGALSTKFIY